MVKLYVNNSMQTNQYNEKGLQEGPWKTYSFITSQIIYKGSFVNGKKVGYWKQYIINKFYVL